MNTKSTYRLKSLIISLLLTLTIAACGVSPEFELESAPVNIIQGEPGVALKRVTPTPAGIDTELLETELVNGETAVSISSDSQPTTKQAEKGIETDETVAAEVVITYERSGGYAGRTETWTIYGDGNILNGRGKAQQGDSEIVANILDQIEKAEFFEMSKEYMPKNSCCDRFTHVITVHQKGKSYQVTTLDDAPNAPESLMEILSSVQQYIQTVADSTS